MKESNVISHGVTTRDTGDQFSDAKKPKPKSKKMCCYGRPRLYFTYVTLNVISLKDTDLTSCIAWGSYSNATTSAFASTCRLVVLVVVNGWLGSRVVSVLDSGAEGPGFKSQSRRCRVTVLGKLFTPIVPLFTKQQHQ